MSEKPEVLHKFHHDVAELMLLISNDFNNSNKEIFFGELISNASSALDKIRWNSSKIDNGEELLIKVFLNKQDRTLTFIDSGIGMTKNDLVNNLGSIPRCTRKVMQAGGKFEFGQIDFGFYSVYLVADRVTVHSKHSNDKQHVWEASAGAESFTVKLDTGESLRRGTKVVLHIREDQAEYLEKSKIESLVAKYLEGIRYRIEFFVEKERKEDINYDYAKPEDEKNGSRVKKRSAEDFGSAAKRQKVNCTEDEDLEQKGQVQRHKTNRPVLQEDNKISSKPIWSLNSADIAKKDYVSFYKSLTNDSADPLAVTHYKYEGKNQFEFCALLFIPSSSIDPSEVTKNCIKFYVESNFMFDSKDVIPDYLSFMKGVVDSASNDSLLRDDVFEEVQKVLVENCLECFGKLTEDKEAYKKFYNQFSMNLKMGAIKDSTNTAKLIELLRFPTSSGDDFCSLSEYVARMKERQNQIYFITGESKENIKSSASVERVKNLGFEVIFMTDPIDEIVMKQLKEYKGKKLICVTKEGLESHETAIICLSKDFRVRINGIPVSENVRISRSAELFHVQYGGGPPNSSSSKNETETAVNVNGVIVTEGLENVATDDNTLAFIEKIGKVRHICTATAICKVKLNFFGNEFCAVILYGNFYYHFGVEAGTKIRELSAAFITHYQKCHPGSTTNFSINLSSNYTILQEDATVLKTTDAYLALFKSNENQSPNRSTASLKRKSPDVDDIQNPPAKKSQSLIK